MKNKWLLVADLGSFKAYRVEASRFTRGPRLELIEAFDNTDAHDRLTDQVTDLAGRFPKGGGPNGANGAMSHGERHNIELEQRKRLTRRLTERINALMAREDFESCFLAVSKEINHQILEGLDLRHRAKIEQNLAADLTKIDKSELLRHFTKPS
ncbi:MAG: host attachment protein [Verrucomicrobiae bacterium]|nr:host attachment protein [Verrucomicrobiae bacterium]